MVRATTPSGPWRPRRSSRGSIRAASSITTPRATWARCTRCNFYTNLAPVQELDDWFEHWATKGVKPLFTCEYRVPCTWDWTMYRGWYKGERGFGSAAVPWEFCMAEWSSQFLGDRAYRISEAEKTEPALGGRAVPRRPALASLGLSVPGRLAGLRRPARDHRRGTSPTTGGPSAPGACRPSRRGNTTSSGSCARRRQGPQANSRSTGRTCKGPGFSPDYIGAQYERMDLAFERVRLGPDGRRAGHLRNNLPLLAYIGGKPAAFTSKDHNFFPGETVEKQLIVINNSRETVTCDCDWSLGLPQAARPARNRSSVATGEQERIPLQLRAAGRRWRRASTT